MSAGLSLSTSAIIALLPASTLQTRSKTQARGLADKPAAQWLIMGPLLCTMNAHYLQVIIRVGEFPHRLRSVVFRMYELLGSCLSSHCKMSFIGSSLPIRAPLSQMNRISLTHEPGGHFLPSAVLVCLLHQRAPVGSPGLIFRPPFSEPVRTPWHKPLVMACCLDTQPTETAGSPTPGGQGRHLVEIASRDKGCMSRDHKRGRPVRPTAGNPEYNGPPLLGRKSTSTMAV